jgi:hypothetical protein
MSSARSQKHPLQIAKFDPDQRTDRGQQQDARVRSSIGHAGQSPAGSRAVHGRDHRKDAAKFQGIIVILHTAAILSMELRH